MVRIAQLTAGLTALWMLAPGAAMAQPAGSYEQSCSQISQRGPTLQALCQDTQGRWVPTQIDVRGCGPISNSNGRLACERRGGGDRYGYDDRDDRRGYRRGPPRGYDEDDDDYGRRGYRSGPPQYDRRDYDRRDYERRDYYGGGRY